MTFDEGLPEHFIVFSQTPKAQEHTRQIFVRFCLFLVLPIIGIVVFGNLFLSLILAIVFVVIFAIGWREWLLWQRLPFAVNPSHPMMELESNKQADVMIRLQDGR